MDSTLFSSARKSSSCSAREGVMCALTGTERFSRLMSKEPRQPGRGEPRKEGGALRGGGSKLLRKRGRYALPDCSSAHELRDPANAGGDRLQHQASGGLACLGGAHHLRGRSYRAALVQHAPSLERPRLQLRG